LKALAAALVLGTAISSACFAQAPPADSAPQPAEDVAPATDGAGSSGQHAEAVGGLVEADVHASGEISASTDSGHNSGSGALGASLNGVGAGIGGGGAADLPGLPDSSAPKTASGAGGSGTPEGQGSGGAVQPGGLESGYDLDANGDGGISSVEAAAASQFAGLAGTSHCPPIRVTGLKGNAPDQIRAVRSGARIRLVLLCAAENSLDAAQLHAIEGNPALTGRLSEGGFTADEVVALSLRDRDAGTLYVVAGR
jgi:hypothetical protein